MYELFEWVMDWPWWVRGLCLGLVVWALILLRLCKTAEEALAEEEEVILFSVPERHAASDIPAEEVRTL